MNSAVSADPRAKIKENVKVDKFLNYARNLEKAVEYKSNTDPNCRW